MQAWRTGLWGLLLTGLLPLNALAAARIVQPAPDATVHSNSGDVHVVVEGVSPGDSVLPVLDGKPAQVYYATPEFDLHGVDRGSHVLYVEVQGPRERVVGRTPAVRFHVWHASRLIRP